MLIRNTNNNNSFLIITIKILLLSLIYLFITKQHYSLEFMNFTNISSDELATRKHRKFGNYQGHFMKVTFSPNVCARLSKLLMNSFKDSFNSKVNISRSSMPGALQQPTLQNLMRWKSFCHLLFVLKQELHQFPIETQLGAHFFASSPLRCN